MKTSIIITACWVIGMVSCTSNQMEPDASGVFETTEVIVSAKGSGEILSFRI